MTRYFIDKKIDSINWNIVNFEDWTTKYFTDKELSYLITEEPKDLTQIRDLMLDNVVPEIIKILNEHNVRKWDIQAIIN